MGSEYYESVIRKILKATHESLESYEKRICEQSKPHWWSIPKEPDAYEQQLCERLRSTIPYIQQWQSRLAATPEFPAGSQTSTARQTAIGVLKNRLLEVERETAPKNVQLTYGRRRYEPNDNGGGGPGRWVSDAPGNYFDDLKELLIAKLKDEIKALEEPERPTPSAPVVARTEAAGPSRPARSSRRSGNCPICGADPDEPHHGH
jgi:hypothetical protein